MNNVISNIAFIISDLLLLFNLVLINISGILKEQGISPLKLLSLSVIHGIYTMIFNLYFAGASKLVMSLLLTVYYLRFVVFPCIITKRTSFISFYMPLLLISLDSLIQSCVLWIFKLTTSFSNELMINKISSRHVRSAFKTDRLSAPTLPSLRRYEKRISLF